MTEVKDFDLLLFIGRFQPFHNEHKRVVQMALDNSKHVLVLIGSAGSPRTVRNPFTYDERESLIRKCFPDENEHRLIIKPLYDKTYNDMAWIKQIQDLVKDVALDIANPNSSDFKPNGTGHLKIGLIGAAKDHTSYYLKLFPQWQSIDAGLEHAIHATALRDGLFHGTMERYQLEETLIPRPVSRFIFGWDDGDHEYEHGFINTDTFRQLQSEMRHIEAYKKSWAGAPYPVKHMTVDAVVEQSGHILLVKRRAEPGKGLLALPGGHLDINERTEDGMIRELREETKIKVPDPVLRGSIIHKELFDDPHRSTIGRVITHAFYIKLKDDVILPKVKGADDAEKAMWIPLTEIREDGMFDDHWHIINCFLGTY